MSDDNEDSTVSVWADRVEVPRRRGRKRWLRWGAVAALLAAVVVGAVFGSRIGTDPTLVASPLLGKPAPTDELPRLEGQGSLSLKQFHGKVTVVTFWASWCTQCRDEQPTLVAAANAYGPSGVAFVGIDYQDQQRLATAFLDELGRGNPTYYHYVSDPGSQAAIDFGVYGVPETFVLDRSGTIIAKISGAASPQLLGRTLNDTLAGRKPGAITAGTVAPGPKANK